MQASVSLFIDASLGMVDPRINPIGGPMVANPCSGATAKPFSNATFQISCHATLLRSQTMIRLRALLCGLIMSTLGDPRFTWAAPLHAEITGDLSFGFEIHISTFISLVTSDTLRGSGHVSVTSITVNGDPIFPGVLPGDYNNDGVVDSGDYETWKNGFGMTSGAARSNGDGDGDADVDGADFLIWQLHLGSDDQLPGFTVAVPEPITLESLIVVGIALAAARRPLGLRQAR